MHSEHHHEAIPRRIADILKRRDPSDLKIDLWNSFVDSGLIGICDDDCSALPRFLPLSYLRTIEGTCYEITLFLMRFLSLPAYDIKAILPPTPIVDYLVHGLEVLKHRPRRIAGSLRYDMSLIGEPSPSNPPKLFEVNEIGFDGTGRSSYIQETILRLCPELRRHVRCLDTAASEVKNMRRLGKKFARLQYNYYNWEEEVILMKAARVGLDMRLFCPANFKVDVDEYFTKLKKARISLEDGQLAIGRKGWNPNAFQLSYSFELKDYKEAPRLFKDLVRTSTPQYSPFITGLISPKTILLLLADRTLRRRLLGTSRPRHLDGAILPAISLDGNEVYAKDHTSRLVLKRADGMGGEFVWVGNEMRNKLRRIPKSERRHWILQERVRINTIDVDGVLSRKRRVIADLGAYIHYDWNGREFTNFSVGGFITRATNRSLKVNVSGGGIQVPVMFYV